MSTRPQEPLITAPRWNPGPRCTPDLPPHEQEVPPPLARGWINLQDLAHTWATTGTTLAAGLVTTAHLAWFFQGMGQGYLALSHEECAYAQYQLVANRLRYPPGVVAEGLEQTLTQLHEASIQWIASGYWFERLANEGPWTPEVLEPLRSTIHLLREQQERLWTMLRAVAQEQAQQQQQRQATR